MAERRLGRRVFVPLGVLVLGGIAAGSVLVWGPDQAGSTVESAEKPYDVVRVEERTLTVGASLPGTVGYGDPEPIAVRADGTVTWLPKTGTLIERGQTVLRVDDQSVTLFYGTTPAYRDLYDTHAAPPQQDSPPAEPAPGSKDPAPAAKPASLPDLLSGPDVVQLEENLHALGYHGFTVDEEFTDNTADAVAAFQRDRGEEPTGRFDFGSVVFLPGPIRAVADAQQLGQAVSPAAIQQTSADQVVTVALPSDQATWATPGTKVELVHGSKTTPGTVTSVGPAKDDSSVPVWIRPRRPLKAATSVTVTYVEERRPDVLAVPVTALVALAEGGYGVQLENGAFVAVQPGLTADGFVEVTGVIDAGAAVRVPR